MPSNPPSARAGAATNHGGHPALSVCARATLFALALGLGVSAVEARHRHGARHVDASVPRDPANPWERVPQIRYRPVLGDFKSYKVVEPLSWEELNRRVAPQPGQKGDMNMKMDGSGGGQMKMNGSGQMKH